MKTIKPTTVRAMALAAVAIFSLSALAVTPYATLTWTGLAGDGKFTSVGNWSVEPSGKSIGFGCTNDYKFIDVADNTTITIPSGKSILFVNNLTVSNTTDTARTLTITGGSKFQNFASANFYIHSNCVLNVSAPASNPWTGTFNGYTLRGGGTIKYTSRYESWGGSIQNYASKVVLGFLGGLTEGFATVLIDLQSADSTVELSSTAWTQIRKTVAGSKIKLNDYFMYNILTANNSYFQTLAAEISGSSSAGLVLMGAVEQTLTTSATMNGTYEIRNSGFKLGTSAAAQATIPSDSIVNMYSHGALILNGDQQIGALTGDGAIARVSVPSGKTLTVGGRNGVTSSTFAGRLSGAGNFVKTGADYSLAMSGDSSDFSGNVTVSAGTLELKRPTELDPLPTPAAKWTFDTDLVDEIGGVTLVNGGSTTVSPQTLTGAYGKGISLKDNTRWLKVESGGAYPFPTGNVPFTVSLRVSQYDSSESSHVISFGDTATAYKFFSMGFHASRRANSFDWQYAGTAGAAWTASDQNNSYISPNAYTWDNVVATYDGATLRFYRDGRFLDSKDVKLNLTSDTPFYMGYYPNFTKTKPSCYVDDFRVWTNCCFSADQVATLARTLDGRGVTGQFTNSTVIVNSGATLKATGSGNEVKSLSGSGTLNLSQNSTLTAGGGTFSGAVTGSGQLTLTENANFPGDASQFSGVIEVKGGATTLNSTFANGVIVLNGGTAKGAASDITIAEGTTIAIDGNAPTTPKITTSGRLILPDTLTITVSPKIDGEIIVATAGTVVMPSSTANWTLPTGFRVRNNGGKFRLATKFGAVLLMR